MQVNRQKTSKSILWSSVENGGLAIISFVTMVAFSRILLPADFGLVATALALTELIGLLPGMFFHDALIQRRKVTELDFDTAFSCSLAISVICFFFCVAVSPLFSSLTKNASAGPVLSVLATTLIFNGAAAALLARYRREFKFRALAIRSLTARVCGTAFGLAAAVLGAGPWSLVLQYILMSFLNWLLLWMRRENLPRLRIGQIELFELSAFGFPAIASLFANFAARRCFALLSGLFLGLEAAGYLILASRTIDTFWSILASAVSQVVLPAMASLQGNREALRRIYQKSLGFCCAVFYPVFAGLSLVAHDMVELVFGARWLPAAPFVAALTLLVFVQAQNLLAGAIISAIGKPKVNLAVNSVGLFGLLAMCFITRLSTPPLAVAVWVISQVSYTPVYVVSLSRFAGLTVTDQIRPIVVPAMATIGMAAAVTMVRLLTNVNSGPSIDLAIACVVGVVTFAIIIRILDRTMFTDFVSLLRESMRR